ncbi:unnamed protein product [Adineta steineri]|uniref:Apple domain-containing protein n=1 Tax=Adineta steineri TaxID=433720 RepID=A0A815EZE1_9BILA|nr:unnamed protein product [Adineta steineri]CAF1322211.1 unnamed protein product [Adineta steineri]CAF1584737.1 unnamed protein product [Adineta steineri]CAF1584924.1 unnamed protein product [Adineta steineri]
MTLNYITDCFYEKRLNTALQGYNDLSDRWISDYDCFDRCLRTDHQKCRSFEYWHKDQSGLCIRANISLADHSSITGHSAFVDYYEINCRKDMKAIRPSEIYCPGDQLFLTVRLNGFNSNNILLGDKNCKPTCNIYQIRSIQQTSTIPTLPNIRHTLPMLPSHGQMYHDDQKNTSPYRINIKWTLSTHSYYCPESCLVSLYSLINVTLVDLSLLTTRYSIDSCDLRAISPYTNYVQSKQLISQGCSIDPSVIYAPIQTSQLSIFYFSFHLYHILKEPIPFQIHCKVFINHEKLKSHHHIDCASLLSNDNNRSSIIKNDKKDYAYTLFRSASVFVTRHLELIQNEQPVIQHQQSNYYY